MIRNALRREMPSQNGFHEKGYLKIMYAPYPPIFSFPGVKKNIPKELFFRIQHSLPHKHAHLPAKYMRTSPVLARGSNTCA